MSNSMKTFTIHSHVHSDDIMLRPLDTETNKAEDGHCIIHLCNCHFIYMYIHCLCTWMNSCSLILCHLFVAEEGRIFLAFIYISCLPGGDKLLWYYLPGFPSQSLVNTFPSVWFITETWNFVQCIMLHCHLQMSN
jgi:hypothetical protein